MASPQINFAHLCDSAFLSQDNKLNIIGIFKDLYARKFPLQYPKLTVVMNVLVQKGNYDLGIELRKKGQDKPVLKMNGDIKSDAEKDFNLIVDFPHITFEDQRDYIFEISINGEKLKSLPFAVKLLPQKS